MSCQAGVLLNGEVANWAASILGAENYHNLYDIYCLGLFTDSNNTYMHIYIYIYI